MGDDGCQVHRAGPQQATHLVPGLPEPAAHNAVDGGPLEDDVVIEVEACLLYTSDAADDLLCVDLGGRRLIKKKIKKNKHNNTTYRHRANTPRLLYQQ